MDCSAVERVTSEIPDPSCSRYRMAERAPRVQVQLAQPGLCVELCDGETQSGWSFLMLSTGSRNNLYRKNHGKREKKKKASI